jgi:hypothetical protein
MWAMRAGDGAAGYGRRLAGAVNDGLRACGLPPDAHGANAANPLFAVPGRPERPGLSRYAGYIRL